MIILLQLIAVGIFILIGLQIWNGSRSPRLDADDHVDLPRPSSASPAGEAADALRALETARADIRGRYPILFGMLGGYLNDEAMREAGGIELAVKEMIDDWTPRKKDVVEELLKVLSENPDEDEIRAIILACCDATFEEEGYRAWLTWLLGNFNKI
ncbi:MAG: hypothetical protein AAGJ87_02920 [Pseudomonadota bacterium]